MDFSLTEEQQLLKDSVVRFVEKQYDFESRRRIVAAGGLDEANWALFAEMGWLMAGLPEDHGGLGGGIEAQSILCEALGAGLVVEPFIPVAVMAARTLLAAGGPLAAELLPQLAAGSARPVLAHAEPGAFGELAWVETVAVRSGAGWIVNGRKAVVWAAPYASHLIVSARTSGAAGDADGLTLFLLPANGVPGLTRRDVRLSDGSRGSEIDLADVTVGDDAVIGALGQGHGPVAEACAHTLVALCAEAVGAMDRLVWLTRDYLNTRVQFGKPIGTFQALQHRMADMLIELEMSRSQVCRAMAHLGADPASRDRAVSSMKVQIGRSARFVGGNAIQLHGGIGISEEYVVGHYFKRLTMIDNALGTVGLHLDRMAALGRAA
jgi:alkylation response protein AidB-like acyl-CoA dehydrogenase